MRHLPFLAHSQATMPLQPLERKAAFMAAVTMRETNKTAAATDIGVSWQHLLACLDGERIPSAELGRKVAEFVGISVEDFWGNHIGVAA